MIAPRLVVTAAHCITQVKSRLALVGPDLVERVIVRHASHPLAIEQRRASAKDSGVTDADLPVLRLDRAVDGITPIQIAAVADDLDAPGMVATTIGTGATTLEPSLGPNPFKAAAVVVRRDSLCTRTPLDRVWALCVLDPRLPDPCGRAAIRIGLLRRQRWPAVRRNADRSAADRHRFNRRRVWDRSRARNLRRPEPRSQVHSHPRSPLGTVPADPRRG